MVVRVLVDTDMGWDDCCALCFLACHPNVEIVGVCVNGCGASYLDSAVDCALRCLGMLAQTHVPVGIGLEKPLSYQHTYPDAFKIAMDKTRWLLPERPAIDMQSADVVLCAALKQYPDLIYLSLGGFSNLCASLRDHHVSALPQRIVAMGGAVSVPGNIASLANDTRVDNHVAEWNLFIDPLAADEVMQMVAQYGTTLMLAPLDICHQAPLTQLFIDQLQNATNDQPVVDFVSHLLQRRLNSANAAQKSEYLYDLLTAWLAIADDCHIERRYGTMSVISQTDQNPCNLGKLCFVPDAHSQCGFYDFCQIDTFRRDFINSLACAI